MAVLETLNLAAVLMEVTNVPFERGIWNLVWRLMVGMYCICITPAILFLNKCFKTWRTVQKFEVTLCRFNVDGMCT